LHLPVTPNHEYHTEIDGFGEVLFRENKMLHNELWYKSATPLMPEPVPMLVITKKETLKLIYAFRVSQSALHIYQSILSYQNTPKIH
jgi:hypothetical protein